MAIKELSVFYKQFEAEQAAARERARRRRIEPDLLPRDVLARLEPDYRHFEILPLEEARSLEASDTVRLFLERKGRWEAVPNLRRREPGQKALAFRRRPAPMRGNGGRPRRPRAPLPVMSGTTVYREPSVSITRPAGKDPLKLGDRRHFGREIVFHTVQEGDTAETIARRVTGRSDPRLVLDYLDGKPVSRDQPLRPDAMVRVINGDTLRVGGGASNANVVQFAWQGPTTGTTAVAAENEGWEYAFPVLPGIYTLTVTAGESRHARTVEVVNPAKPKKSEVAVRVGVFFDGTGNNKDNDIPKGTDTNVARLFELFRANEGNETTTPVGTQNNLALYTKRIYLHGVGTEAGAENDSLEMATGSGAVSLIETALDELAGFLSNFSDQAGPRIVDVFGFSRGAASARDFVNRVNAKLSGSGVRVGFVGIFDTVGSFGLPGNDIDVRSDNPLLTAALGPAAMAASGMFNFNLSLESALRVVHLAARNEYRANFPLQSLRTGPGELPPPNMEEITVPGAHADVGGGYGPEITEELHHVERRELSYRIIGPPEQWQAELLRKKTALEAEARTMDAVLVYDGTSRNAVGEAIDTYWLARKRHVKPGLSNVYLHAMYAKAVESGVPFNDIDDQATKFPARFGIPEDLVPLFSRDLLTPKNETLITNIYTHRSDINWKDSKSITEWLTNHAESPRSRDVYFNDPEDAIKPSQANQKTDTI